MIVNTVNVFGWLVQHCKVSAGEIVKFVSKRETNLDRLSAKTIYTKGLLTSVHTNDPSKRGLDRGPGFCTDSLPNPLPALDLTATAQLDTEWWCISLPSNKTLPNVEFVNVPAGNSLDLASGSLVFICQGMLNNIAGPVSFVAEGNPVSAQEDTYGFIFDKRNENI